MSRWHGNLRSAKWILAKGFLFLATGVLAAALLIAEHPTLKVVALLAVAVWCFARFYYFAFYVIEHYIDPGYRFDGLLAFARYCLRNLRARPSEPAVGREKRDA